MTTLTTQVCLVHGSQRELIWHCLTEQGPSLNDPYSLSNLLLWIAPSFVGRSIDLQTKGHPSRNLGSGRWVVPFCLTENKIGKTEVGICSSGTKGWGACRLAFPKSRWSPAFKQGRYHHISLIPWDAIFFFYWTHHAYLISYHHSDVIQFSFSQIFCMPTWTLFFRPTRLPFKLWDLPGLNQSINKIWQNLCVETICQENWHRNSARNAFCCSFVRLATFTRLVC